MFGAGTPNTLLTLKTVPIWYGTKAESTTCLSLGFITSIVFEESSETS